MTRFILLITGAAAVLVAALGADQIGPAERQQQPPLILKSTFGADLYRAYCSNCHGVTGKGGTSRSQLHAAPPDLTVLARENGGVYPRDRVRETLLFGSKAPEAPSHGTSDMPVWGTIFKGLDPSDRMGEIRVENLVQYIGSLQEADREGAFDQP